MFQAQAWLSQYPPIQWLQTLNTFLVNLLIPQDGKKFKSVFKIELKSHCFIMPSVCLFTGQWEHHFIKAYQGIWINPIVENVYLQELYYRNDRILPYVMHPFLKHWVVLYKLLYVSPDQYNIIQLSLSKTPWYKYKTKKP